MQHIKSTEDEKKTISRIYKENLVVRAREIESKQLHGLERSSSRLIDLTDHKL